MIADDRRSRIADRRSQKVLLSFAIIWKHTSTIVCDPVIVITDDCRRSQKIEPCSIFCDRLRSSAIVCDQLRSCDHMETKVLWSAIQTYPIIFWIPTHDSMLLSNKARIFACSNRLFVVNMAGVEQGNVSSEEFMEEFARYECVYHRDSKDFRYKSKTANFWKKSGRNLIYKRRRRRPNSAT